MFEAKSGLRKIATNITVLATSATLIFASSVSASAAAPKLPATVAFLKSAFTYTDVQTRMTTGFALEALIQLAGAGLTTGDLEEQMAAEFTKPNRIIGTQARPGFLMDSTSFTLKPGLAAKFLFASAVLKAPNPVTQATLVAKLESLIANDGGVAASDGNAQDVAWVVLGLQSQNKLASARKVAAALIKMQHRDGGFNYDPTLNTGGTDVTAISIQALESVSFTTKSANTKRTGSITKAVQFLKGTDVGNNHFEAWGDLDPNGTAYAIMGLQAAGQSTSAYVTWLRSKLKSDGGVEAPWAPGSGDRYVTAQAYLPLIGKNYLTLLATK